MLQNLTNITFLVQNATIPNYRQDYVYVTQSFHAISLLEIILAIFGYIVLIFLYIKVNNQKEKYSAWINPKGRKINLVKMIKMYVVLYPIVVILLCALQIWLFLH